MNKLPVILILNFLALTSTCFSQMNTSLGTKKLATTMTIIEKMYVDKVDDAKLAEDAITALLEKLDPHSSYITANEVKELNEPLEGNFDGIGISFNLTTDTVYIMETIAGGPSEKVGILPGDRIVKVNDTIIAGVNMSTKDIMRRLRGPKGTTVNVNIFRKGIKELLNFKITRAQIPIYSLDAAYMVDKSTGYIRLSRFGATTHTEFQEAIVKLQKEGLENLILDLQGNGGGYLSAAVSLADEFLSKDKLIVYTEGANQPRYSENSTGKGLFETGKLVVLVNEMSASASEILAGAIQDWDRGLVIGRRTFGKGLVQRPIPLPDGSMLRLTVARYHTPTGRCIQKPYVNGDKDAYDNDLMSRYKHGEMMNADSIQFPDSLKYKTLINERIVYGGGGIMPDEFVPLDTMSTYHRNVMAKGIIHKVYLNEVDNHRKELKSKYPTVDSFKANYIVSEDIFDKILKMAEEEKIEFDEKQYNESKMLIGMQIKALIAQNIFDAATYYKIMNDESRAFQKGLEVISDNKKYQELIQGK